MSMTSGVIDVPVCADSADAATSIAALFRPEMMTWCPALASSLAVSNPMPRLPPVTRVSFVGAVAAIGKRVGRRLNAAKLRLQKQHSTGQYNEDAANQQGADGSHRIQQGCSVLLWEGVS
jgi:hypothetical protein